MATMLKILRRQASACIAAMAGLMLLATSASAETLLMPKRDFAANQNEVVWGISTLPNGTAYSIDFGDTTPVQNGNVTDRSFIAFNHTFPIAGTFTVTLTVGAEVATTTVNVYDLAGLTAEQARGVNINRAIEDGLRYLWTSQTNQAKFDTSTTTACGSSPIYTSLVVL